MIGSLGSKIIFQVSDETALFFTELNREISGRWAVHETMGTKPKPEFLGPGNQSITMPIYLSAGLGVHPRSVLEEIEAMVETGAAEYFIIGTKPVGKNPFRVIASSEAWGHIYSRGELAKATVSISLEEYT